ERRDPHDGARQGTVQWHPWQALVTLLGKQLDDCAHRERVTGTEVATVCGRALHGSDVRLGDVADVDESPRQRDDAGIRAFHDVHEHLVRCVETGGQRWTNDHEWIDRNEIELRLLLSNESPGS